MSETRGELIEDEINNEYFEDNVEKQGSFYEEFEPLTTSRDTSNYGTTTIRRMPSTIIESDENTDASKEDNVPEVTDGSTPKSSPLVGKQSNTSFSRCASAPTLSTHGKAICSTDTKQHERQVKHATQPDKSTKLAKDDLGKDSQNNDIASSSGQMQQSSTEKVQRNILQPQNHPELEDLLIIDEANMERASPNGELIKIDNSLLHGVMLPMIRTSDIDSLNDTASNHFKGKSRRFEIQLQFKMKYVPENQLFLGFEMDEAMKLGMIQRALVGATMNFMKKRNQGFIFNLSSEEERADLKHSKAHISVPLETCADHFTVSKPGEDIPQLGTTLYEDPDVMKIRKKGKLSIEYNTVNTYTVAIWSAYVDFVEWKVLNLPAIRPFSLSSVIGNQTFRIVWYLADPSLSQHRQCDMNKFVSFEFGHRKKSRVGPSAKKWMQTLGSGVDPTVNKPVDDDDSSTDSYQFEEASICDESNHCVNQDIGTLEELGEGLYLKSGDPIQIRESILDANPSYVTSAGGFAILESQNASTIVVKKILLDERISSGTSSQSKVIKNGDTVMISLIEENQTNASKSTKYLAIHENWGLKWVSTVPETGGYFQIYTNDMEELIQISPTSKGKRSFENQSSFVRLGGTFQLRAHNHHKLNIHVGAKIDSSPKLGGRVMGLYKENSSSHGSETYDSSPHSNERNLMKPLYLCASLPFNNNTPHSSPQKNIAHINSSGDLCQTDELTVPVEKFYVDAPAWLEIMHRRDRGLQLLYLLRISKDKRPSTDASKLEASHDGIVDVSDNYRMDVRLRTGNNLKEALRLGLDLNRDADTSNIGEDVFSYGEINEDSVHYEQDDYPRDNAEVGLNCSISSTFTDRESNLKPDTSCSSVSIASAREIDSEDSLPPSDYSYSEGEDDFRRYTPTSPTQSTKKLNWSRMGNVAKKGVKIAGKGVKYGTVLAGKGVIKSGKIVGQSMRLKKSRNRRRRRRRRNIFAKETLNKCGRATNQVMAGQLTAPDQSVRIVSNILSGLSSIVMRDSESKTSLHAASLLSSELIPLSEFDSWFLKGDSVKLGVAPMIDGNSGNLDAEYVVARCLWESHWREEVCLIYEKYLTLNVPLSKKACLKLSYVEIQQVRLVCASEGVNPLPGFPLIAIETSSRCHYLAFSDEELRANFQNTLNSAIFSCPQVIRDTFTEDTPKAKIVQPLFTSLSEEYGKWASIVSSKKSKQRIVHNSRRMAFDTEEFEVDGSQTAERSIGLFVEDLLRQALSFSLETLEECQGDFVNFLNCTSRLRTLPLQKLNLSGKEALCICVNLYHCLLQHSLLLSRNGPPTKRSIEDFMRTNCYEIGGDVFSLAELQIRVIRGNMSKAIHPRSPFVQAPRKSRAHLVYAIGEADPRINFVLNTADKSKTSHIPILTPDDLDRQLSACSTTFLRKQVSVDLQRNTVTLPKVCEVYRNDFGDGDASCCVHYCLQYLDKNTQHKLLNWLQQGSPYIRYHQSCNRFHSSLELLMN